MVSNIRLRGGTNIFLDITYTNKQRRASSKPALDDLYPSKISLNIIIPKYKSHISVHIFSS